jgi:hypothetical protein
MEIELLYFEGCQGQKKARPLLDEVLAEEGIRVPVHFTKMRDQAHAVAQRFQGSPTIRINGRDLVEQADTDYALRCRVYWVDGRPQDYPSKEMIRAALRAATMTIRDRSAPDDH